MTTAMKAAALAALCVLGLTACSGGGGSAPVEPSPAQSADLKGNYIPL